MPRRPAAETAGPAPSPAQTQQNASSEGIEDVELPRMIVAQLAKSALTPDVRFDEDTVTALIKGSTVFINHLTAAAQEIAASRAHKTISGADVLKALEALQFSNLAETLQEEFDVYRQGYKGEKSKSKASPESKARRVSMTSFWKPGSQTPEPPNNMHVERIATDTGVPEIEMQDAT